MAILPDDVKEDMLTFVFPPAPWRDGFADLGPTPLVKQLGLSTEQTSGHWCSRCRGIWFGMMLEVECPVCGNRRG